MFQWVRSHPGLLWSLVASLVMLIASLVAIPALIVRIPPDYFTRDKRALPSWAKQRPFVRVLVISGKNILGGALILASIVAFPLPGLGVVTILIGLLLVDVPGKHRFMKWLIGRRFIRERINRLRKRRGREPVQFQ